MVVQLESWLRDLDLRRACASEASTEATPSDEGGSAIYVEPMAHLPELEATGPWDQNIVVELGLYFIEQKRKVRVIRRPLYVRKLICVSEPSSPMFRSWIFHPSRVVSCVLLYRLI